MPQKNRRLITLGILVVAAFMIITLGRQSSIVRSVISGVMIPLRPITGLFNQGAEAATDGTTDWQDYQELEAYANELEHAVAEMQTELVRLREIERDYDRLSALLNYASENSDQSLVTADVISRDTSSYLRWVIINRGTREGVQVGNPVVSEQGFVGRVEYVAANVAWIRLAIDPAAAVNARLQNAGLEGTVIGQLQGGLRMEYIPQTALVEVGDLVLTSGLGGTLPPNIVIGQVSSVRRQQGDLFQSAEVRPTVDYDQLQIVSVITSFEPLDISVFDTVIETEGEDTP